MIEIVFATSNPHKLTEVSDMLGADFLLRSLVDVGYDQEIAEPYDTFAKNAMIKARTIFGYTGLPTLADDSGLVVPALGGAPGVLSARYAGVPVDHEANMSKLLAALNGIQDRRAFFETVLAYVDNEGERLYRGVCEGTISDRRYGDGGFGYDPIFVPQGYEETFGTLGADTKNSLSHRAKAIDAFSRDILSV